MNKLIKLLIRRIKVFLRSRKFLFLIIVLLLITGGVFYWKNQQEVADLNKELPEGVRVVKTLTGDYVVVNKIDGYQFKVPDKWEGVKEVYYTSERTEQGYSGTSIELEGLKGVSRILSIDRFKTELLSFDLEKWGKDFFNTFGLIGNFSKDKVGEFEIVKTRERIGVIGYVYFFQKNLAIYTIACGSEEFIREIIANGKW